MSYLALYTRRSASRADRDGACLDEKTLLNRRRVDGGEQCVCSSRTRRSNACGDVGASRHG